MGRVVPAQQSLERTNAVLLEVEERLVIKLELAALDGEAKVALELAALLGASVEAFLEESERAAAGSGGNASLVYAASPRAVAAALRMAAMLAR